MIRVGIIGCGRISQRRHVPEYSANPYAEIAGYYDFDVNRAVSLMNKYGGRVYNSIEEMLNDPTIDAVSVCAANNAHASISIQAMKAGKHVLCEKPMATTVEDCQEMVRVAEEMGVFLMVAQNQRYNTGHARAKELIQEGIIGTPLTFRTFFCHGGPENWIKFGDEDVVEVSKDIWFFDKNIASMGVMADLGIHKADLIQYILGDEIAEVTAKVMTLDKRNSKGELIELEDNAMCIYKMKSGIFGTLNVSWTDYGSEDNATIIFGTKGNMRLYDDREHTIMISTNRGDKIYYDLDRMMTNENQLQSGVIREFIRALRTGDYSSAANGASINAIRAILAGFESSAQDRTIVLSEFHP